MIYWRCLDCPVHGTTTGTESGADVKHVRATNHATTTHTAALQNGRVRDVDVRGAASTASARRCPAGWQYDCDGMPTPMGCGEQITVTRRYAVVREQASA